MTASETLHEVISLLQGVRGTGNSGNFSACCPAHDDSAQSLGVGPGRNVPVVMTCYAGCSYENIVAALVTRGLDASILAGRNGITVEEMAVYKRLPIEFLLSLGLRNGSEGRSFAIPYWTETYSGAPSDRAFRQRIRSDRSAKTGSLWGPGKGTCLYGLWKLNEWASSDPRIDYCVLVEGESDSWTGWFHNLPFLGIPGSKSVGTLKNEILTRFTRIYIWQEPDAAGAGFVFGIAKQLDKIGWHGSVKVISMPGVKDPSVLHCRDADAFDVRFREAMDSAPDMPSMEELERAARAPTRQIPGSIGAISEEIAERPVAEPGFYNQTDYGNAQRMHLRHGQDVKHVLAWNSWIIWNGQRWQKDEIDEVRRRAIDTVLSINSEAMRTPNTKEGQILREQLIQHAKTSEGKVSVDHMVSMTQVIPGVRVKTDQFDCDPFILNVRNGIIDLRTGNLLPHNRDALCMKMAPVDFDASARCPQFDRFISRIMNDDDDVIKFLQTSLGYSITGDVREECMFFCFGSGANGKTTLFETIAHIMGDYQGKTQAETLLRGRDKESGSASPELIGLHNLRFVSASELEEDRQLNEAKLKDLTGKDAITARNIFEKSMTFYPVLKLWMYGNHKPEIRGQDNAIWRRLKAIPFVVSIREKDQDKELAEKLAAESSGILNWLIAGCLRWQQEGLLSPSPVSDAIAEYRSEQDEVYRFIEERIKFGSYETDRAFRVSKGDVYVHYQEWCKSEGIKPRRPNKLSEALHGKGWNDTKSNGIKYWIDVKVDCSFDYDVQPQDNKIDFKDEQ